jgi:rare lipoprotein A
MSYFSRIALVLAALALHGCGSLPIFSGSSNTTEDESPIVAAPVPAPAPAATPAPSAKAAPSGKAAPSAAASGAAGLRIKPPAPIARNTGKYFQQDGPGEIPPDKLQDVPEPTPRDEPLAHFANRNYIALGKAYRPETERKSFKQRGVASWYGKQFHGRKTSIGERYDMYAISAAHPTLPLPSFVRVTNLENQRSIVVRVNDRGPFLRGRVIDLSYAAAAKLGFAHKGSANVEVESVIAPAATGLALVGY